MNVTKAGAFAQFWIEKANEHQERLFTFRHDKNRNLLVERQQGTTMGIAAEAIMMGLDTGRVQVFVAPTQKQALIVKEYARHLLNEFETATVSDVIKAFRFVSPVMLKASGSWLAGVAEFDLYISDWMFMPEDDVELIRAFGRRNEPIRSTWVTALPQTPRFEVLALATRLT